MTQIQFGPFFCRVLVLVYVTVFQLQSYTHCLQYQDSDWATVLNELKRKWLKIMHRDLWGLFIIHWNKWCHQRGKKSAVARVVNSTTNVHSRIVKRTVHTAGRWSATKNTEESFWGLWFTVTVRYGDYWIWYTNLWIFRWNKMHLVLENHFCSTASAFICFPLCPTCSSGSFMEAEACIPRQGLGFIFFCGFGIN